MTRTFRVSEETYEGAHEVIAESFVAALGDSNDSEIEVLQEARDLLASVLRIDTEPLAEAALTKQED